ncbi:unnamed protein product, partial [Ectocarpus sp. 12 AP-2014]
AAAVDGEASSSLLVATPATTRRRAAAAAVAPTTAERKEEEEDDDDDDGDEEGEAPAETEENGGATEDSKEDGTFCHMCRRGKSDPFAAKEGRIIGPFRGVVVRGQPRQLWVHRKCAEYSPEVEEVDGELENVAKAIRRGASLKCFACGKKGATVGCFNGRCRTVYHVPCARSHAGWDFEKADRGKEFYCLMHQE